MGKGRPRITGYTFLQKVRLLLFDKAYLRHELKPGWKAPLPIYAVKCPFHGVFESHPQGNPPHFHCPKCRKETLEYYEKMKAMK